MLDPTANKKHAKNEGKGDKRKIDPIAAAALDALSRDSSSDDSDSDDHSPLGWKKTTSGAAIAKKKTTTIEAAGGGIALPKKYNLGHLKPLFNGKCCH
jgi:hypothetical protein